MKIIIKLISVILILVLIPTIIIGYIANNEAKQTIILQEESAKNLQLQEINAQSSIYVDVIDAMHSYAATNIETNMKVARDKFKELCGDYANKNEETLVCETGAILNDANYSNKIVKEVRSLAKGHSSIFVKINDSSAKKISTTVTSGIYAYGNIMSKSMFDSTIVNGELYNDYVKTKGIFKTRYCDPISDSNEEIVGALCVGITENDVVANLKSKLDAVEFSNDGQIYVLSNLEGFNEKEFVIHNSLTGTNGEGIDYVNSIIEQKNGVIEYEVEGVNKIASFSYYEPYEWILVAESTQVSSVGAINEIRNTIILTGLISILLAIIVGFISANLLVKPIKKLTEAGNKIAEGDITAKLPEIKTKDEVQELGLAMNMLVGALKFLKEEKNKPKKK